MRKIIFFIFFTACFMAKGQAPLNHVALSAIQGTESKVKTLTFNTAQETLAEISGSGARYFIITSGENETENITLKFAPENGFIGLAEATLALKDGNGAVVESIELKGLSTKALEGKNEPSLDLVLQALNYKIDVGWTSLGNHTREDLQGEELPPSLFKKRGETVEMIPLARYSPPFELPYGYYTNTDDKPKLHQVAVLAGSENHYEHQTLFPSLSEGSESFDPGDAAFGFYTTSPSHTAYSEDKWNKKFTPDKAAHAVRIYAIKDSEGNPITNTYLVCFEEAQNGDYQDYVYLVNNIGPVGN